MSQRITAAQPMLLLRIEKSPKPIDIDRVFADLQVPGDEPNTYKVTLRLCEDGLQIPDMRNGAARVPELGKMLKGR